MDILSIKTPAYRQFNNAEHVQYHVNVRNAILEAGAENLGLPDPFFNPYTQAIDIEQDVVNRASGSAYTLEMEQADKKRDLIFRRVRHKLSLCELEKESSIMSMASAVVKKNILSKYPGSITVLPYQEETAHIAGLILDCRNILSEEQLDAFGISEDLEELETTNNHFAQMYQGRVTEKAEGNAMLSAKLRAATDNAYFVLVLALNQLANDPTPANKERSEANRTLIQKINVIANDAKNRLNQRLGSSSTEVSEETPDDADQNQQAGAGSGSTPSGSGSSAGGSSAGNGGSNTGSVNIPDDSMGV